MPKKRPKSPGNPSQEPQWKTVEKVVALLEQSLDPHARIRHDVKLPHLTTGHPIQCDVVIETGPAERTLRTIVEVQKRQARVKPNDFRGWCKKKDDVGAHRLICVSAKPFPQSIIDNVRSTYGPTVLLVQLESLEQRNWPREIAGGSIPMCCPKPRLDPAFSPNPLLIFDPADNPFAEYEGKLIPSCDIPNPITRGSDTTRCSITTLVSEGFRRVCDDVALAHLKEGTHRVTVKWNPTDTILHFDGRSAPIRRVEMHCLLEFLQVRFPIEILSYTPEGQKPSTWLCRATGSIESVAAEVRFILRLRPDGSFAIGKPECVGFPGGWLVLSHR